MKSLNERKGATISELEVTLIALRKLIKRTLEVKPNSGMIIAKGKPNEARLKYQEMLVILDSLEVKLSQEGCLSFGICKTCGRFNPKVSGRGCFGACGNKIVHEYDSCDKHTLEGGCFGL